MGVSVDGFSFAGPSFFFGRQRQLLIFFFFSSSSLASLSSPLIAAGWWMPSLSFSLDLSRLTPQLPAVPFTSNMMTRATVSVRETGSSSTTTQHARTGGKIKSVADECVSAASVDRISEFFCNYRSMDGCGWGA